MPRISVVIPAFRPPDFDALRRSMQDNADADAEWIVVDDGSGPDHAAAFATLEGAATVLRLPENRRQGAARNAGLAAATAPWVKFLDADDRLDAGHLTALLKAADAAGPRAIPFAPTLHVFPGGATSLNDSWRDLPATPEAQLRRMLARPFMHHCGALFPRDLLLKLGGYEASLVTDEDGDLLLRILREGFHFTPVEDAHYLYIHRAGGGRVSSDDDPRKLAARVRVCDRIEASFSGAMPAEIRAALAQRMDRIAMTFRAAHPAEAQALMERARRLHPDARGHMPAPLRLLRRAAGAGAVDALTGLRRRLKGRPAGGAQG